MLLRYYYYCDFAVMFMSHEVFAIKINVVVMSYESYHCYSDKCGYYCYYCHYVYSYPIPILVAIAATITAIPSGGTRYY